MSINHGESSSGIKITKSEVLGHFSSRNTRHSIYSLDFQPNGRRLATGGADCSVKIWDIDSLLGPPSKNNSAGVSVPFPDQRQNESFTSAPGLFSSTGNNSSNESHNSNSNKNSDALLSSTSLHTKAVNSVRWSNDGRYLASGSDDTFIIIYHKLDGFNIHSKSSSSVKNVFSSNNQETWTRCFTLHGHSMDVLDIDWSPLGLLASASVDNLVMIWNPFSEQNSNNGKAMQPGVMIPSVITPLRVLRGHEGFVKGVSFDPMGRYLLSCGSDNLYICWDGLKDFSQVHKMDHIAKNAPDNSLFRRVSWSPDGASVLGTVGIKSYRAVGAVIRRGKGVDSSKNINKNANDNSSRDGWDTVAELVGHDATVAAGRFCPLLFKSANTAGGSAGPTPSVTSLVVIGDLLGVLSLWTSNSSRSPLVIREALSSAVTDISWLTSSSSTSAKNKVIFAASSLDGNVVLVEINETFGKCLADNEFNEHISSYYGWDYNANMRDMRAKIIGVGDSGFYSSQLLSGSGSQLAQAASLNVNVHHPIIRKYMGTSDDKKKASGTTSGTNSTSNLTISQSDNISNNRAVSEVNNSMDDINIKDMQKETLSKSGKKRIQPVSLTAIYNESISAESSNSSSTSSTTNMSAATGSAFRPLPGSLPDASSTASTLPKRVSSNIPNLDETMMRGAKRVRTPLVSDDNAAASGPVIITNNSPFLRLYYSDTHIGSGGVESSSISGSNTRFANKNNNHNFDFCDFSHILSGKNFVSVPVKGSTSSPADETRRQSSLHASILRKPQQLNNLKFTGDNLSLLTFVQPSNISSSSENNGSSCRSETQEKDKQITVWKSVITGSISAVCAVFDPHQKNNSGLCCVGTLDGTLMLFSLQSGMKISCDFVVGAPVSFMDIIAMTSSSPSLSPMYRLAILTADGDLLVYSISDFKLKILSRSTIHTICKSVSYKLQLKIYNLSENNTINTGESAINSNNGCKSSVTIDKFHLDNQGFPLISLAATTTASSSSNTSTSSLPGPAAIPSNSNSSIDTVDWQSFYYCLDSETWVRVSDLKNTLSSLFLNSNGNDNGNEKGEYSQIFKTYHNWNNNSIADISNGSANINSDSAPVSLSALQSLSVRKVSMNELDVLKMSNAVNRPGSLNSSLTGNSILEISHMMVNQPHGGGINASKQSLPMNQWVALSTLAHIEARLSTCGVFSSSSEAVYWLQEYVKFCVKNGLDEKITSLINHLLQKNSNISPSDSRLSMSSSYSDYNWIENIIDKRRVIDLVIVPTLGSLAQSSVIAQNLLVHIYELLKDFDLSSRII